MKAKEKIEVLEKLKAYIKSEKFGRSTGLGRFRPDGICIALSRLKEAEEIYLSDIFFVTRLLPPRKSNPYCWRPGLKKPRIKWIDEQIKLLEGKK
jgi:hypothetical protein